MTKSKVAASALDTAMAARNFTRRSVLKAGAAAGSVVLTAPALIENALASSGEVDILMWSDYLPKSFTESFKKETGITINFTGISSNEEIINKLKASKGLGFDLCSPTNNRNLAWEHLGLLQPYDMSRIDIDKVNPAMAKIGTDGWNFDGKGVTWVPHIWGTEGMAWRTDKWAPEGGVPSYGDTWAEENAGKTMGRAHSMLLGLGLWLEAEGKMPEGSIWAAYKTEDAFRKTWSQLVDFAIAHKNRIKVIWNDADSQKSALLKEGVIVGQAWDGPPLALKTAGEPVTYQAPKEGAMAWVDGIAMPIGAKNIDQAYEFLKFAYQPKPAGIAINDHGYNSPVLGADKFASANYAKNFAEAYPGDALANLNPWPSEPPWYGALRTEFTNKFKSA